MLRQIGFGFVFALAAPALPALAAGEFFGELVFVDGEAPCDAYYAAGTVCRKLAQPFCYSANGLAWETDKDLITDGASIPEWAQGIIGEPMTEAYAQAATLHDHYCRPENNVRDYRLTHRMFHQVLIDSGVELGTANIMYLAVLIGGPKWSKLVAGEDCELIDGKICVKTGDDLLAEESAASTNYTEAKYDVLPMEEILADLAAELEGQEPTLAEIEGMAALKRTEYGYSLPGLYAVSDE